ncbi:MAG: hypothetical protein ACI4KI_01340 [Candidatus Fimenecus sp.]
MKIKRILKITAIAVCAALVAAPLTGAGVYFARGNLSGCEVSDDFKNGLSANASKAQNGEIRIMSANLLVGYKSWGGLPVKPRAMMFTELLAAYSPDVIGLQEVCDGWYCALRNMPDGYRLVYPISTGVFVNMTALAYNSNKLELLEKGKIVFHEGNNPRLRRVVWALFEVRDTGKKFIATSTHFDLMNSDDDTVKLNIMQSEAEGFTALIGSLSSKYGADIPIFSTGDYNSKENTPETEKIDAPQIYEYLAEKLNDSKYCAQSTYSGSEQTLEQPLYDHIFYTGKAVPTRYELLSQPYLNDMSDHYPVFCDFSI